MILCGCFQECIGLVLGVINGLWDDLWRIVGDSNVVRFPSERSNGLRLKTPMRRLFDVIYELELRDLSLVMSSLHDGEGRTTTLSSRLD